MPKLGKKQSVLKQGISRKRKGFKGVQKQAKRAASATSERRVISGISRLTTPNK